MLLLVVVEDGLLILALISLVVLGPLMPRILVGMLLGHVVFFARAEISGDDNDVVHGSGRLKFIIDGLVMVLVVLGRPLVVSVAIHRNWIALIVDTAQACA